MRSYDSNDTFDVKSAKEMGVEQWMLDILELNPKYPHWGPREDYMYTKGDGWNAPVFVDSWSEFDWKLDDLNECVHYYFQIHRDSINCEDCNHSGYNPETKKIYDDYYDFENTGRRWCDNITQDELDALIAERRMQVGTDLDDVNEANSRHRASHKNFLLHHDAINSYVLVQTRAKRLGVYGHCVKCNGTGSYYTAPRPHMSMVLWMIHPRKGASRGVEIKLLEKDDIQRAITWLAEAAKRNAKRFSKIVKAAKVKV